MNSELDIYKKNRIAYLQNMYNANVSKLYTTLTNNILSVQRSNQLLKTKQTLINKLKSQFNSNVAALKNQLIKNKQNVENFKPSNITINSDKKALLIGINYVGTSNELYGCVNDALSIQERIQKTGFTSIKLLTNLEATRTNILTELKNLLIKSKSGDFLLFSYSGHGSYTLDKNGDEKTYYDQCIIPCDLNYIIDDELKTIIQTNLKAGVTLFALFDSCFSGSVLDLRYQYMDSLNYDQFTENNNELETLGNVFMISGCTDYQTSADAFINNASTGAMTWSLLESIKQKPNCTWRELVKSMRDLLKESSYSQIPQFSSGTFMNIDTPIFI
jgi:hypothetical protein